MTTTDRPTRATYSQVLSEPRFRVLFGTRTLAIAADTLRTVALSTLVFSLTGSALLAAIAFGISFLPQVIGGAFLGALADRVRPRRVIVVAYTLEATAATILAVGRLPIAINLVVVALVACGTPVFAGAASRLVAEVLSGDAYVLGRSLWNMAASAAQLAGLAGGGLAVVSLGPRGALLVSAGCYLSSAVMLRLRLPDLLADTTPPSTAQISVLNQSWSGNTQLLKDPPVRVLLLAQCLPPAFMAGAESLVIPYAGSRDFPAASAGLLLVCLPIGMIIGNLAVSRLLSPALRERATTGLIALCGLSLLPVAFDPPPQALGALLVLGGAGFAYGLGIQRQFLDVTAEELRGQAFGLLQTCAMTLQGLGPLVFGALTEALPIRISITLAGVFTLVTAAMLQFRLPLHAGKIQR
jgi:predicted MFS family arabinose efflux permease